MRNRFSCLTLLHPRLLSVLGLQSVLGATVVWAGSVAVKRATDVPEQWEEDQHLYVKGDVGLPPARLAELETWLDTNAPHWTIVLLQSAADEAYREAGGQQYHGLAAVENALGRKLPATTDFGKWRHPLTQQASGAFFVLSLQERKFSYFASEVYDTRALGEDRWVGNLDRSAIQAMRSGGNIANAVKNTITAIQSGLERALAAEAEAVRQAEAQKVWFQTKTETAIVHVEEKIKLAESRAGELRRLFPKATGELVSPPLTEARLGLSEARSRLTAGQTNAAAEIVAKVDSVLTSYFANVEGHANGARTIAELRQEIASVKVHEHAGLAQSLLEQAETRLAEAADFHQNLALGFDDRVQKCRDAIAQARLVDVKTRAAVERFQKLADDVAAFRLTPESATAKIPYANAQASLRKAEVSLRSGSLDALAVKNTEELLRAAERSQAQDLRAAAKRQAITTTTAAGGSGTAALLALLGNRRRRKVKQQAEEQLRSWDTAFQAKTEGLLKLLHRTSDAVGTVDVLERSGWQGSTMQLAKQTIGDVDQLFVMSSSLDKVLDSARSLIFPKNPAKRSWNLVAEKNYQKALTLLTGEQLSFGKEDQLRPLKDTSAPADAKKQQWDGLLGKREDTQAFSMSLAELDAAFHERAQRALDSLDKIEQSWDGVRVQANLLEQEIDAAEALEAKVHEAAATDGLFPLNGLFDQLLPSARADHATGRSLSAKDPVRAMDEAFAAGSRKSRDAARLCNFVIKARAELFPRLQSVRTELTSSGRATAWIQQTLAALSADAEALANAAITRDGTAEYESIAAGAHKLDEMATEAVRLQKHATELSTHSSALLERVTVEKRRMAETLGIRPEAVLNEKEWHPLEQLERAKKEHSVALAELDRGAVEAAKVALEAVSEHLQLTEQYISETSKYLTEYPATSKSLQQVQGRLEAESLPQRALAERLQESYAPSALTDTAGSIVEVVKAEKHIQTTAARLQEAATTHAGGAILQAARLLELTRQEQETAGGQLAGISSHAALLEATERENELALHVLHNALAEQASVAEHPHTTEHSNLEFQRLEQTVSECRQQVEARKQEQHPFAAKANLQSAQASLEQLVGQFAADHALFQKAVAKSASAKEQLVAATPLVTTAEGDGIADSPATTESLRGLLSLAEDLTGWQEFLQRPQQDWDKAVSGLDQLSREAAQHRARLKGELDQANRAVDRLHRAARAVRQANQWRGSHGVRISQSHGNSELASAEQALTHGDYPSCIRAADEASKAAKYAVDEADAEVRRKRRAAERRQVQTRRAAESSSTGLGFLTSHSSSNHDTSPSHFGSSHGSDHGGSSSSAPASNDSSSSSSSFSSDSGTAQSGW